MKTSLHRPGGVLLAGVLVSSVFAFMPAAHAADGTISGTVTDANGPLQGVRVNVYDNSRGFWSFVADYAGTSTRVDGSYTLALPPGDYRIGFTDYFDYIDEYYNDAPDVDVAQTLSVASGGSESADAELATASHISGTVTGPDGPVFDVNATAYKEVVGVDGVKSWEVANNAFTDEDGTYNIGTLPAGSYRIGFEPYEQPGLAEEFYDDQASLLTAKDVVVGDSATISGIDPVLGLASEITGTVTNAADGPLAGAEVHAHVNDGGDWGSVAAIATTDASGSYTLEGLAAGTYRVEFEKDLGDGYAYEAWNDKGSIDEGDDIIVGSDVTVTGTDAKLVAGEHDPLPFLEGVTIPMISGAPQVGATLSVTAGTWEQGEVTATYQWFNDAGAIAGATATTYVPTATDVGKSLVVIVEASKPGFQNRKNMSNGVGPVTAAPVVTPAPAPAPVPVITFSKKIDVVGALTVGSTLKLKKYKALVTQAAVTATYKIQWFAGSKKIKKATKPKLLLKKALKGKKISVKVTAKAGTTTKTVKVKVGKVR